MKRRAALRLHFGRSDDWLAILKAAVNLWPYGSDTYDRVAPKDEPVKDVVRMLYE